MLNYTTEKEDTLEELGQALLNDHALRLLYKHLKSMPDYPNKEMHLCSVVRKAGYISTQIEILSNRLILLG